MTVEEQLREDLAAAKSSWEQWELDATGIAASLGIVWDADNVDNVAQRVVAIIRTMKFVCREVAAYGDCHCTVSEKNCVYCTSVMLSNLKHLEPESEREENDAIQELKEGQP